MPELITTLPRPELAEADHARFAYYGWSVRVCARVADIERALEERGAQVWAVSHDLLMCAGPSVIRQVTLRWPMLCVIVVVDDGVDDLERARWIERGAHDTVRAARSSLPVGPELARCLEFFELVLTRHTEASRRRGETRRRTTESVMLRRLITALGGKLDPASIIYETLSVVSSMCRHGAVAYLEAYTPEPYEDSTAQLFSESEVEYEDLLSSHELYARRQGLRLVDQLAHDRGMICLYPSGHSSWQALLDAGHPQMYRAAPRSGMYPGLEPLWRKFSSGEVWLVPIRGRERALGVLVIAEFDTRGVYETRFGAELLGTLGGLLGSRLETATLFSENARALESLQAAQKQLVHAEKFAAVGHLAAQIAHEINNPASFVISNISVMGDYVQALSAFIQDIDPILDPERREQYLELMRSHEIAFMQEDLSVLVERSLAGMQRIHQVVQDLRHFAYESSVEPNWVDVEALLDASLNLIKHELKFRSRIDVRYEGVPHIFSDANKLSQVMLNLLVNASQSLVPENADSNYIEVGTMKLGESVLVYIEDNGVGIDPDILPRIFEPFFTTKRRGEGTGLGLSISRNIIRRLGGDIRVHSEQGKGARFELLLPNRAPERVMPKEVPDSGSYKIPPELRPRKITPIEPVERGRRYDRSD